MNSEARKPRRNLLAADFVILGLLLAATSRLPSVGSAAEGSSQGASLIASAEPGWPQFRGPRRDGISDERGLLQTWPDGGPKALWRAAGAGRGFSSPIIAEGRLFVTGDIGEDHYILAYDLEGKQLWKIKSGAAWLNQYQGARASVTYSAGRLFHQNAHGRVVCLDAATGADVWSVNVLERYKGENITWGLSECLLVDERAVYVTPGGRDALIVALDKRNGRELWRSAPQLEGESGEVAQGAGYAAPIMVRFAGRRLIIGCAAKSLFCVDADTGAIQWTRPRPTSYSVLAMSPVLAGDGVFMSAPFGPPGALHRLIAPKTPGDRVGVSDVWTTALDTAQGGVVYADGRLYGSYYPRRGGWAALDASTGQVLHENRELTKGSAIFADGRLYMLCEDGWMLLQEPRSTAFEEKGRFRMATPRDRDAWAHPVIHDGRLYLRYHDTLVCYDIRAAPGT
jgi:outer membrane protein assembly factor BamB